MGFFLQHHVNQQLIADKSVVAGAELFESSMHLFEIIHDLVGFGNHFQCIVITDGNTLSTALAFAGIDDDRKLAAFTCFLFRASVVLGRLRPLFCEELTSLFVLDLLHPLFPVLFTDHFPKNGGIGAQRYTVHAASAFLGDIFRYFRRHIAKVAQRRCTSWNHRASQWKVRRQMLFSRTVFVSANHPVVEVINV